MTEFALGEMTYKIIGAAMRVHGTLGNGLPEVLYQRALAVEFKHENIMFEREASMAVYYNGVFIGRRRVDFLVEKLIPVEIKALSTLEGSNITQALNYLEAFNLKIGLLINFGSKLLGYHRLTNKKYRHTPLP